MDKKLTRFIQENPDFFEGTKEARVLRGDIRPLFEEYAQAYDPAEYAELKKKVEAFREQEKTRLQHEVDQLTAERREEEERFRQLSAEIEKYEKEVNRLERRLSTLLKEENSEVGSVSLPKAWYNSGYTFLLLDFLGVLFLYAGLLLNERLTLSYVAMGIVSIFIGFMLQQQQGAGKRNATRATAGHQETDSAILHQNSDFKKLTRIKQLTLNSQKKVALSRISELNCKIDFNLSRINEQLKE